jgi:hypothetical protein
LWNFKVANDYLKGTSHEAKLIRKWAKTYYETQKLPKYLQGHHSKLPCLINDEDIKQRCTVFLRCLGKDPQLVKSFKQWIEQELLPSITNSKTTISSMTVRSWLRVLGYSRRRLSKGTYFDGHEREDVQIYRHKFLSRWKEFQPLRSVFDGHEMNEIPPELPANTMKHILIVHDESIFSANDGVTTLWTHHDDHIIMKKGNGRSVMVSAFLCECHGQLFYTNDAGVKSFATEIIHPGKNADGWWTNENLVEQLRTKAIRAFDQMHPGCKAIFAFDNSQNHHAKPPDGLCVNRMNLSDGGKNVDLMPPLRNGKFNGRTHEMNKILIITKSSGETYTKTQRKGVKRVLEERGLWKDGLKLSCPSAGCPIGSVSCCARKLLSNEPDFKSQKIWLEEIVTNAGHEFIFFPKFHCEFNFIEMWWGEAKRLTRLQCDYTFDGLKKTVPQVLNSIPVIKIRRFARKCERYISCYQRGLPPKLAEYACKTYRSHRCIPSEASYEQITAQMENIPL